MLSKLKQGKCPRYPNKVCVHRSLVYYWNIFICVICIPPQQQSWGGILVSRLLNVAFSRKVIISHIWTTHGRKMFPIEFGVKMSKVKCTGQWSRNTVSILCNVTLPPRVTIWHIWTIEDVPYQIWGQKSSALDIEVAIWFPGSRTLPFPPRVTVSHIWTKGRGGDLSEHCSQYDMSSLCCNLSCSTLWLPSLSSHFSYAIIFISPNKNSCII
jgi:hypothetical protein